MTAATRGRDRRGRPQERPDGTDPIGPIVLGTVDPEPPDDVELAWEADARGRVVPVVRRRSPPTR